MPDDVTTLIARIRDLLRDEAEAIRRGDFAALGTLAERKQALTEAFAVARGPAPAAALGYLRAEAAENARLLSAALRGVTAARERLAAIQRTANELQTYDRQGRSQTVPSVTGAVERRA